MATDLDPGMGTPFSFLNPTDPEIGMGTPFSFFNPAELPGSGMGTTFSFLNPEDLKVGMGAPFGLESPGFYNVGAFIRVKQMNIDVPFPILNTTVAGAPDPTDLHGHVIFVTDETGGATLAFSDGEDWRRWTDRAIIS